MRFNPKKEITEDQKKFLIANCENMSIEALANHLQVSKSKVMLWKKELNLIGKKSRSKIVRQVDDTYYFSWSRARSQDFIFHNV